MASSKPNHLPEAPPPNTIPLGGGAGATSMQSMALSICWAAVFSPVPKAMGGGGLGGVQSMQESGFLPLRVPV